MHLPIAKEKILKLQLIVDAIANAAMDKKKQITGSCQRNVAATVDAAIIMKPKLNNHHNSISIEREQRRKVEPLLPRT